MRMIRTATPIALRGMYSAPFPEGNDFRPGNRTQTCPVYDSPVSESSQPGPET